MYILIVSELEFGKSVNTYKIVYNDKTLRKKAETTNMVYNLYSYYK